jgi:hypothetical protein
MATDSAYEPLFDATAAQLGKAADLLDRLPPTEAGTEALVRVLVANAAATAALSERAGDISRVLDDICNALGDIRDDVRVLAARR